MIKEQRVKINDVANSITVNYELLIIGQRLAI